MSIRISKRSSNSPQLMPKRAEMTEVSMGEVQIYIVLCGEGTLIPQWEWMEQDGMNNVVMFIRGLPSSKLWVLTLPVVPASSSQNQMVLGGSGGSSNSEIVGFDWSYQFQIQKWYFVTHPCPHASDNRSLPLPSSLPLLLSLCTLTLVLTLILACSTTQWWHCCHCTTMLSSLSEPPLLEPSPSSSHVWQHSNGDNDNIALAWQCHHHHPCPCMLLPSSLCIWQHDNGNTTMMMVLPLHDSVILIIVVILILACPCPHMPWQHDNIVVWLSCHHLCPHVLLPSPLSLHARQHNNGDNNDTVTPMWECCHHRHPRPHAPCLTTQPWLTPHIPQVYPLWVQVWVSKGCTH